MSSSDEIESINDPVLILDILEKIKLSKTLLSINIPHISDTFTSSILDINDRKNNLSIDSLTPDKGQAFLLKAKTLSVGAQLNSIPIRFNTNLIKSIEKNAYLHHQIQLPEKIVYQQKRKEYRVNIAIGLHIALYIRIHSHWHQIDRMTDISIGGFGILIDQAQKSQLEQLEQPIVCRIQFNPETLFHFKANICHVLHDEHSGRYQVGIHFEDLTAQDTSKLLKIIRTLERDNIRKEPRSP